MHNSRARSLACARRWESPWGGKSGTRASAARQSRRPSTARVRCVYLGYRRFAICSAGMLLRDLKVSMPVAWRHIIAPAMMGLLATAARAPRCRMVPRRESKSDRTRTMRCVRHGTWRCVCFCLRLWSCCTGHIRVSCYFPSVLFPFETPHLAHIGGSAALVLLFCF